MWKQQARATNRLWRELADALVLEAWADRTGDPELKRRAAYVAYVLRDEWQVMTSRLIGKWEVAGWMLPDDDYGLGELEKLEAIVERRAGRRHIGSVRLRVCETEAEERFWGRRLPWGASAPELHACLASFDRRVSTTATIPRGAPRARRTCQGGRPRRRSRRSTAASRDGPNDDPDDPEPERADHLRRVGPGLEKFIVALIAVAAARAQLPLSAYVAKVAAQWTGSDVELAHFGHLAAKAAALEADALERAA